MPADPPRFSPSDDQIQSLLGLYTQNRLAEAQAEAESLIEQFPGFPLIPNILGAIFSRQDRTEDAANAYRKATEIDPGFIQAYNNLGVALKALGRPEEAVDAYRKALEIDSGYAEAWNNLGAALRELNRHREAIDAYEKAAALDDKHADAHYNRANALRDLGDRDGAAEAYLAAIRRKPDFPEAYRGLSAVRKFTTDDPLIAAMKGRLPKPGRNETARMNMCFALAKAYADTGDTEAAFSHLSEGNALRKKQQNYRLEQDEALFDLIRTVFAADLPPPPEEPGAIRPVFIVGMPRSGTSLAEQILASHSTVFGAGELSDLNKACVPALTTAETGLGHPVTPDAIASVRRSYQAALGKIGASERVLTDKMPLNFRWIGFIAAAFPESPIINLKRDPMAVCWSIYQQFFTADGLGFAWDLSDIGRYYRLYEDLMSFWHDRFPDRIYDLDYQSLTENQEDETRALLNHCGLAWEDQCLQFHETGRVVKTASQFQVTQALYRGSSDAWRAYEPHLAPLKEALGDLTTG